MPLFRKLTVVAGAVGAARQYARNNPEKVNRMAERAGTFIDRRTNGKYHKKINGAMRKVYQSTGTVKSR